ncbi:MAG TPA: J domain-containing protein [Bacteroidia bacterium]|nr:J domain-containing protein [Bacteroidia bacterium]
MVEQYYNILGVTHTATLAEIKKAFRTRAKELHPDLNKNSGSHQQFILLNEAYEYLINLKTGKVFENNSTTTKRYKTYERWQDNEAARARHRAEYYANRKYQDFTESEHYKKITEVHAIVWRVSLFLLIAVLVMLPIVLTLSKGSTRFWATLILTFIALLFTVDVLRKQRTL